METVNIWQLGNALMVIRLKGGGVQLLLHSPPQTFNEFCGKIDEMPPLIFIICP